MVNTGWMYSMCLDRRVGKEMFEKETLNLAQTYQNLTKRGCGIMKPNIEKEFDPKSSRTK